MLMFPLDFCHREKAIYKLSITCARRESGRAFVLYDVAPFQSSGSIHRRKPARQVTERAESAADQESPNFPDAAWLSP